MPASNKVVSFIGRLLKNSRPSSSEIKLVKKYVEWGISPRGGQYLLIGAKARAFLYGRPTPSEEDIKSIAHAVFDHRIIVNFLAEADGVSPEELTEVILNETN
jgi:MoxR-like ATPase